MLVTSFVYCESIQSQQIQKPNGGQVHTIVNPYQTLTPYSIPGKFSFSISIGMQGDEFSSKDNSLKVDFFDPESNVVHTTNEINVQRAVIDGVPVQNPGLILNVDIRNMLFTKKGIYTTKLSVNGEHIGSYSILVTEEQISTSNL